MTIYIDTDSNNAYSKNILMRILSFFISIIFVINFLAFPLNIFAQDPESSPETVETVDVYAVFWPIVPGKTVNDSMFWVKQLKESFGGMFSFGNINKSENQITISEKRLVEANKLFEDKDYPNALKTLDMNKANRDSALDFLKKAKDEKRDVDELKSRLVSSLENQQLVLKYLETKVPNDQKSKLAEIIKDLTLQISEAR